MAQAVILVHLTGLATVAGWAVTGGQVAISIVGDTAAAVLTVIRLTRHIQLGTVLSGVTYS